MPDLIRPPELGKNSGLVSARPSGRGQRDARKIPTSCWVNYAVKTVGDANLHYRIALLKVSQLWISPEAKPCLNQYIRWADVP